MHQKWLPVCSPRFRGFDTLPQAATHRSPIQFSIQYAVLLRDSLSVRSAFLPVFFILWGGDCMK